MPGNNEKPTNEWAFLGRGILRTFVGDVKTTAIGVCVGALLGVLAAYFLGVSVQSGAKIGALAGAFLGLASRSLTSRLFDYDQPDPNKKSDI